MIESESEFNQSSRPKWTFHTTHWSVVLAAQGEDSPKQAAALDRLCRDYRYPIYAFIRREGHSKEAAEDLTQEFFSRLLEKRYLDSVDPVKGRFRTFLLASVRHFLANERDRARAAKRGGGQFHISLDDADCEGRYEDDLADHRTPEQLFDRAWAVELLTRALGRLREDCRATGKEPQFDALKQFLDGEQGSAAYAGAAVRLKVTEEAVRLGVVRLRKRYQEIIREHIVPTVPNGAVVDDELRHLIAALRD